jgi:hypothetical protein
MTFHSSRNAANEALKEAAKSDGLKREQSMELAQAHIALAQAEAFHDLSTELGNVVQAIGRLR